MAGTMFEGDTFRFDAAKRVIVLGGGTAGWFAALYWKMIFPHLEVMLVQSSQIGTVGVGEGSLPNLMTALQELQIDLDDFFEKTQATYKLGIAFEGWRVPQSSQDVYFHIFSNGHTDWVHDGWYPKIAGMLTEDIPLDIAQMGMKSIFQNVSQANALDDFMVLADSGQNAQKEVMRKAPYAVHFDSKKLADYLEQIGVSRGVIVRDTLVEQIVQDEQGYVTALITDSGTITLDFMVDASGLSRTVVRQFAQQGACRWLSFSEYLLVDRAIPFQHPHTSEHPSLVTRSTAMNAGWLWNIPLQHRVGTGYVYSSSHISDERAIQELEQYLNASVDTTRVISFTPGCYDKAWINNVLVIGLAAGFVEPIEATSIGQMLDVLRRFLNQICQSGAIVPKAAQTVFNEQNVKLWCEIRDFLRMHYDHVRQDNTFWQDANRAKYSTEYLAMREAWQYRMPRENDLGMYNTAGQGRLYDLYSWLYVAVAQGIVPKQAAVRDLTLLAADEKQAMVHFLNQLMPYASRQKFPTFYWQQRAP